MLHKGGGGLHHSRRDLCASQVMAERPLRPTPNTEAKGADRCLLSTPGPLGAMVALKEEAELGFQARTGRL